MIPWRCPDAAKQGRAALACPRGSASASRVGGVACPSLPDTMMTRCSPANFLGWVIRSGTFEKLVTTSLSPPVLAGRRCVVQSREDEIFADHRRLYIVGCSQYDWPRRPYCPVKNAMCKRWATLRYPRYAMRSAGWPKGVCSCSRTSRKAFPGEGVREARPPQSA